MRRKKYWWLWLGSLALLLAASGAAPAATVYTYIGPDGGNWSVAGNWSDSHVPDGAADQAWINNAAGDVTVNLDMPATLSGLTVDAGDNLQFSNAQGFQQYLNFAKDGDNQPIITNQGTITINPPSGTTVIVDPQGTEVTLSGSGSLVLGGAGGMAVLGNMYSSSGKFINSAGHTIIGQGAIMAPVDNYGTITAQGDLGIGAAVTNLGGGGLLTISGSASNLFITATTVTDGQIHPQDGTLMLYNATLVRTNLGPGRVTLGGGGFGGGTNYFRGNLTTKANLTLEDGVSLYIQSDGGGNPAFIDNQGTITLSPTSGKSAYLFADSDTQAFIGGGGSIVLGGEGNAYLAGGNANSKFVTDNTVQGEGYIQAPVDNLGTIRADGGTLVLSGAVTNYGLLTTAGSGSTLEIQAAVNQGTMNQGTITPNDGAVFVNGGSLNYVTVQDGNVSLNNATLLVSSLGLGSGTAMGDNHVQGSLTTQADLTLGSGARLYLEKVPSIPSMPYIPITNDGTISLSPGFGETAYFQASDAQVLLTGGGSLVLGGEGTAHLSYSGIDSKFLNDTHHTIKGEGYIQAPMDNYGTITAQGGTLYIQEYLTNMAGGGILTISGAGDKLQINTTVTDGQINPQSGTLVLGNATLVRTNLGPGSGTLYMNNYFQGSLTSQADLSLGSNVALYIQKDGDNQPTITNEGTISLSPGGWTYLVASDAQTTFSGGGSLVLGGEGTAHLTATGEGKFINDTAHTIRGKGDLSAPLTNNGSLIAENGTLQVNNAITGNGTVSVAAGATLELNGVDVHTGNFEMLGSAALTGGSNRTFNLTQNFTFTQTDETKWNDGNGFRLQMSGAGDEDGQQSLEVGSKDYGAVAEGFIANFHLESLSLTEFATYACLLDAYNNGNRSSPEALYVDELILATGTTLDLNSLHLYTYYLENIVQVMDGDTRFGGTIINSPVPLPGTLLLLGSGLLGLAGLGWRRWRS